MRRKRNRDETCLEINFWSDSVHGVPCPSDIVRGLMFCGTKDRTTSTSVIKLTNIFAISSRAESNADLRIEMSISEVRRTVLAEVDNGVTEAWYLQSDGDDALNLRRFFSIHQHVRCPDSYINNTTSLSHRAKDRR